MPGFGPDTYHQLLGAAREQNWLAHSPLAYIVLDGESGDFFLRARQTTFPGRQIAELFGITDGPLHENVENNILNLTGDKHRRLRSLIGHAFTPKAADRWRPAMREFLAAAVGRPRPGRGPGTEFVAAIAKPYPSRTIAAVLGAPVADAGRLEHWSSMVQRQFDIAALSTQIPDIERAVVEAHEYVTEPARGPPGDPRARPDQHAARGRGAGRPADPRRVREPGAQPARRGSGHHPEPALAGAPAVRRAPRPVGAAGGGAGDLREEGRPGGAAVRADRAVHRQDRARGHRAPGRALPRGHDRRGLRGTRQPGDARTARRSTSPPNATASSTPSARARTSASASTSPGPNWKRPWRSSPRGCPTSRWRANRCSAASRASTTSIRFRSAGVRPGKARLVARHVSRADGC